MIDVGGSGYVAVASAGIEGDRRHVEFARDSVELHIAAAPDIALPDGTIRYAVWLERDGLPYAPPHTIGEITLQTSDVGILRFTPEMPTNLDHSIHDAMMQGGRIAGVAYTGHEGHAEITVSVPGYGAAHTSVCVGTVIFDGAIMGANSEILANHTLDDAGADARGQTNDSVHARDIHADNTACIREPPGAYPERTDSEQKQMERLLHTYGFSNYETAYIMDSARIGAAVDRARTTGADATQSNHISVWVIPPGVAYGADATGVVGFYHVYADTALVAQADPGNGTGVVTRTQTYQMTSPVRAAYEHLGIAGAPDGLGFSGSRHVVHPTHQTNMYDFAITTGPEGTYDVSVAGSGTAHSAMLQVVAPYEKTYHLRAVPLPVAVHDDDNHTVPQPLFLVSVTDANLTASGVNGGIDAINDDYENYSIAEPERTRQMPLADSSLFSAGYDYDDYNAAGGRGKMLDVHAEFGEDRIVRAVTGDGRVYEARISESNSAIIYGNAYDAGGRHNAILTLEGQPGAARPVNVPYNLVGTPVSIAVDMPPVVKSGEEFPVVVHTVDSFGVPVERLDVPSNANHGTGIIHDAYDTATGAMDGIILGLDSVRQSDTAAGGGLLGVVNAMAHDKDAADGTYDVIDADMMPHNGNHTEAHLISVLHALGGGIESRVTSFLNVIDFAYDSPRQVSAGTPFAIEMISERPDIIYEIVESPWAYEQVGSGRFIITPDTEGDATIVISGKTDGAIPKTVRIPATAFMEVPVHVSAAVVVAAAPGPYGNGVAAGNNSGDKATTAKTVLSDLQVDFEITIIDDYDTNSMPAHAADTDGPKDESQVAAATPHTQIITKPSILTIKFPDGPDDGGYGLTDIVVQGGLVLQNSDPGSKSVAIRVGDHGVDVRAVYERSVQVFVTGGTGTGIYPYGEPVLVAADEQPDEILFLIPNKFAYWDGEGVPPEKRNAESFFVDAERSIDVFAVYEHDYARIMYVMIAGSIAGVIVIWRFVLVQGRRHMVAGLAYRVRGLIHDMRGGASSSDAEIGGYEYGYGGGVNDDADTSADGMYDNRSNHAVATMNPEQPHNDARQRPSSSQPGRYDTR